MSLSEAAKKAAKTRSAIRASGGQDATWNLSNGMMRKALLEKPMTFLATEV